MAKRQKPNVQPFTITRAEFARLLACTPDRITKYTAEGMPGIVVTGGGRGRQTQIDLATALPWVLQRRTGTLDDERTRYFRLQADKIQQELRFRAGELVEADEVEARWAALTSAARERLLSLPSVALQRRLIGEQAEDGLIALVDEALAELAARGARGRPGSR
jgi:phage terminase Nu1 subunit (DNA packaging protein)